MHIVVIQRLYFGICQRHDRALQLGKSLRKQSKSILPISPHFGLLRKQLQISKMLIVMLNNFRKSLKNCHLKMIDMGGRISFNLEHEVQEF